MRQAIDMAISTSGMFLLPLFNRVEAQPAVSAALLEQMSP
jgi:hypothetical protein